MLSRIKSNFIICLTTDLLCPDHELCPPRPVQPSSWAVMSYKLNISHIKTFCFASVVKATDTFRCGHTGARARAHMTVPLLRHAIL
jgi:hypothetical protein